MYKMINLTYIYYRLQYLNIFALLFVLVSCSEKNNIFDDNAIELSFEKIEIEPMLGRPYQIATLDSFLIVADNVDGKGLLIYNLEDSSFHRRLNIGQGPNDIIAPIDLDVYADEVVMLQRRTGVCKSYKFYDLVNNPNKVYQKVVLENSDRCCKTADGFAYMGFDDSCIFSFVNLEDSVKSVVDSFSEFSNRDVIAKYKLFQGNLAYSQDSKYLIYAPFFASYVKFYSMVNNEWVLKESYKLGNDEIENRIKAKANVDIGEADKRLCMDVCTDGENFYILYDGNEMGGAKLSEYRYILKFNNRGKYECVYKVNPSISNISVSKQGILYVVMIDENDGEFIVAKSCF